MTTETLPCPADTGTNGDDAAHFFCDCEPDVAICGADVSGWPVVRGGPVANDCQLCITLRVANDYLCARCGQ